MNQVSWLIYLSGILPNFAGCLIFIGTLILVTSGTYFCVSLFMYREIEGWHSNEEKTAKLLAIKKMRRWCPALVVLASFMWLTAALCPSQETILAITASEFGEQMLHTKTANLAEQALDSWLQRQIHPADSAPPSK